MVLTFLLFLPYCCYCCCLIRRILLILFYFYHHIYQDIYMVRHTLYPTKHVKLHHSVSLAVWRTNFFCQLKEKSSVRVREKNCQINNNLIIKEEALKVVDEGRSRKIVWKKYRLYLFCLLFCYFCLLLENHSSLILKQQ